MSIASRAFVAPAASTSGTPRIFANASRLTTPAVVQMALGKCDGYTAVKEAVRARQVTRQEVFVPLVHRPRSAQVDFGHALVKLNGTLTKVAFLLMALPHSQVFLRNGVGCGRFVPALALQHVDHAVCLSDEIGLVFRIVGARFVVNRELTVRGPEPLRRLALQNYGQLAFSVGLELLHCIEAALELAEEILRRVALVRGRLAVIEDRFRCGSGEGAGLQL